MLYSQNGKDILIETRQHTNKAHIEETKRAKPRISALIASSLVALLVVVVFAKNFIL